jgi:hypothetical protein
MRHATKTNILQCLSVLQCALFIYCLWMTTSCGLNNCFSTVTHVKPSLYRPRQTSTAPADWRFQDFQMIGTWMWQGCQPYAPAAFTPSKNPLNSFLFKADSTPRSQCGRKDCQWKVNVKCLIILSDFNKIWVLLTNCNIRPVGAALLHADRRTGITKVTSTVLATTRTRLTNRKLDKDQESRASEHACCLSKTRHCQCYNQLRATGHVLSWSSGL